MPPSGNTKRPRVAVLTGHDETARWVAASLDSFPGLDAELSVHGSREAAGDPADYDVVVVDLASNPASRFLERSRPDRTVVLLDEATPERARAMSDRAAFALPRDAHPILVAQTILHAASARPPTRGRELAWFEAVIEGISDFVAVVGADRRIMYESPAVERILGYSPEEREGGSVWDLVHPEDARETRDLFERTLATPGKVTTVQVRMRHREGHWVHTEVRARNAITDPDIQGLVVTIRDVTEAKRLAERLTSAEARYRALVEQSLLGIFTISDDGRITYVNPSWSRVLGYDAAEVGGEKASQFVHPDDREEFERRLESIEGDGQRFETRLIARDGDTRTAELHVRALDVEGESSLVGVLRDVTVERRLEAEFLHAQKMEVVGRLASGVAHDFNNLLSAIGGAAHLLGQELDRDVSEDLATIAASVDRGRALTRRLLGFSRKETGRPRTLGVDATLRTATAFAARIVREDVKLELALDAADAAVRADPRELEQLVLNLVVNAQDAMPSGGSVRVESTLRADVARSWSPELVPEEGSDAWVYIRVSDSGIGIPEDVLPFVFEPFFTTKDAERGTGLGLATVRTMVEGAGGKISAHSDGPGTSIQLRLPTTDAEELPDAAPPDAETTVIFLIEDDATVLRTTRRILELQGHEVITSSDADTARAHFAEHADRIGLVLSDVVLPDGRGPALALEFRERRPTLPVVFMSGHSEIESLEVIRELGATLLQKPFAIADLTGAIDRALSEAPS